MFDLHAYIAERARRAGVGRFEDLGLDTYADEARFFSYRRATHRKEADYGRLVAAIALRERPYAYAVTLATHEGVNPIPGQRRSP